MGVLRPNPLPLTVRLMPAYPGATVEVTGPVVALRVIVKSDSIMVDRVAPIPTTPIVLLFTISPGTIHVGQTAILQWNVLNADSIFISPGIGSVPSSGSQVISPTTTTVYTLTASNFYGTRFYSVGIVVTP